MYRNNCCYCSKSKQTQLLAHSANERVKSAICSWVVLMRISAVYQKNSTDKKKSKIIIRTRRNYYCSYIPLATNTEKQKKQNELSAFFFSIMLLLLSCTHTRTHTRTRTRRNFVEIVDKIWNVFVFDTSHQVLWLKCRHIITGKTRNRNAFNCDWAFFDSSNITATVVTNNSNNKKTTQME